MSIIRSLLAGIGLALGASLPAAADVDVHTKLVNSGTSAIANVTMYPLFYGDWSSKQDEAVKQAQIAYLKGIADYINGVGAPAGQVVTAYQYGVRSAAVGQDVSTGTSIKSVTVCDPEAGVACGGSQAHIRDVINDAQTNSGLHGYDANSLILVFLAPTINIQVSGGCSYHSSVSNTQFYGVVRGYDSCGPVLAVTSHEVFEALTDPVVGSGWDGSGGSEAVDNCDTKIDHAATTKRVNDVLNAYSAANGGAKLPLDASWQAKITGIADDTQPITSEPGFVKCSTTGYIPAPVQKTCFHLSNGTTYCIPIVACTPCLRQVVVYPYPLLPTLKPGPPECPMCSLKVTVDGIDPQLWTPSLVDGRGKALKAVATRQEKGISLVVKPAAGELANGGAQRYRLHLTPKGAAAETRDVAIKVTAELVR